MFVQNQKRDYQQVDGIRNINNEKPNAEASTQFWSKIGLWERTWNKWRMGTWIKSGKR